MTNSVGKVTRNLNEDCVRPLMLRSFIAVEIPTKTQDAIEISLNPLKKALPFPFIRWVLSQNIHLTLKFMGAVLPVSLERLAGAIRSEVSRCESFSMTIAGLGAFPNPRKARVIWVGLETPSAMRILVGALETMVSRLGYPTEERPFSPHLTVGRVGQNVSRKGLEQIEAALEKTIIGTIGTVQVDAVNIIKSDLLPDGPVYTRLYTLPLNSI
jgi:2'-5' RNA ligase